MGGKSTYDASAGRQGSIERINHEQYGWLNAVEEGGLRNACLRCGLVVDGDGAGK